MDFWMPQPIWEGQDAFVIGGGSSLRTFDFRLVRPHRTIGTNQAFREGPEVCDFVVFCDKKFLFDGDKPREGFYDELAAYPNPVVTNEPSLALRKIPWLRCMRRKPIGLHTDALGYNLNTGAAALNLALLLGARRIFLLGFDMHLDREGRPNYHDRLIDKPSSEVYTRMLAHFGMIRKDLQAKFPGRTVYNVTDNSSLEVFPKLPVQKFWEEYDGLGTVAFG